MSIERERKTHKNNGVLSERMQPTEMDVCINEKIPFSVELIKTTIHFVFYIISGLQRYNFNLNYGINVDFYTIR